ncbi:ABC transporter permease [Marihabitans asiaticum]|uniref:Oligopeptide transport system permease protein n=1 Tax=Marihabitans asiaticum TaxID=415218 RepID=A0A560WHY0_9MICO|nr:ABC transporter permease [Marihabitans asiaticum]TWD17292.1 oligopeptide transport system permease protein [Marihabitans asiaticum]
MTERNQTPHDANPDERLEHDDAPLHDNKPGEGGELPTESHEKQTPTSSSAAIAADDTGTARSLTADAWRSLRKNPLFWISSVLIVGLLAIAIFPGLFTDQNPDYGDLGRARIDPNSTHWFGTDRQGYDVYTRTIYGARASILVGVLGATGTLLLGSFLGLVAGYLGGWVDTLISRIGDIFFAIPLLMAGIILLSATRSMDTLLGVPLQGYFGTIFQLVLVLVLFGWPAIMRLMRSSVIQVKPNDYVQAARALGASPLRIIRRHVMPNALAPAIVVTTINLGVYISVEATLSFLGIGLVPPAISWGVMINDSLVFLRSGTTLHALFFPALFLSICVLAFIMLGDAVRDAFDPKSRDR